MDPTALLSKFKTEVKNGQLDAAKSTLVQLKIAMTQFQSLPPMSVPSPTAAKENQFACEVLEHAVFLSVTLEDMEGFQRHIAQLKPLYIGGSYAPGDNRSVILGLNLMGLLVENRLAEFHSELELLSESERSIEAIAFPIALEQYLMVGAFNQVLGAKARQPHPTFGFFMASIIETVRQSIAECAEVAYGSLTLASAQQILMLDSRADLDTFISTLHPDWVVEGEVIKFIAPTGAKSSEVPSMRLITECLDYATELERIV
mmetsp:Transcript_32800/g.74038  ORF Transcript_32800/g.74038 Transcript_32800/m.74038 type:complete len:260 (-) Transcript_32800:446-1225(-)|eukprot:CAMPEP_0172614432 /NCGR_PEP_ID=MMETSP1068-20121228/50988_1 /TAXON_ID=35684 /ORGANISM="Pseudopedinella elastica, Strain CCMP716" /LENGTH=259 /DNA_ID=CAMNT_0013419227 /DNA_START=61 /DNA_END=840 /DNA_ORIENTATION=+